MIIISTLVTSTNQKRFDILMQKNAGKRRGM